MPTEEHDAIVARGALEFGADDRVQALWLEGSVARGTDDAASDLDLHIAVEDRAFDDFGAAVEVLGRLGRPLGFLDTMLPGVRLIPATLAGPTRVDLYIERRSAIATTPRGPDRRVVFDRDEVTADLDAAPPIAYDPRPQLESLMRGYWFGAMWPGRFILRGDWGGLLMNATGVVYQFLVPALLIAERSPEFYREPYGRARYLSFERQTEMNGLLAEGARAFATIDTRPDIDAIKRFHERLLRSVWSAFRAACRTSGAGYAEATEDEYREYYVRTFDIRIGAL